jgi:hypothetical protein
MSWVSGDAETRQANVEVALRTAFARFVESRPTDVIVFSSVTAADLAEAIRAFPLVLKPLTAACNIAARAIERDLGIRNLDTYAPRLRAQHASAIAGYLKPFLPPYMEIPALSHLDRTAFVDKEIRKTKGRWERGILHALNRFASVSFKKRKFRSGSETFELDAASPPSGGIEIGMDVKRIEARRDIHKRCDEIVNKAGRLKAAHPEARFAVVVYYPFIDEHANVKSRLESDDIDAVMFAAESKESVEGTVKMLLARLGAAR